MPALESPVPRWDTIQIRSAATPKLSPNATIVLEKRYLAKNEKGEVIESPEDMFSRIAKYIASADFLYGKTADDVARAATEFYEVMVGLEFMPNSPTLMNAGRPLGQLAACFVLPVEDSMDGIFDSIKNMALIHKSGGGTGFSFSRLRPKNDMVRSTAGVSSGPVSFMRIFNTATETVKQGGTRRGANMAILDVTHPDILEFITAKEDSTSLTNFNISVALTDSFMKAVENDEDYDLVNPRTGAPVWRLSAREVFALIVKKAWQNGEPGIVFIDTINEHNPLKKIGRIESTNPCVAGDTWVHTDNGPSKAVELTGKPFMARIDGKGFASAREGFFKTATKQVYRVKTTEGFTIRVTFDHPVLCVRKKTRYSLETVWKAAGDLRPGDSVVLNDHRNNSQWPGKGGREEGYLLGLRIGNGTLIQDKAVIPVWMEERHEGIMEEALEKTSSDFYSGFLRGFFDTGGSVQGSMRKGASIGLSQSNLERLEALQRMLLRLGIVSKIVRGRRKKWVTLLPDGRENQKAYSTRARHELIISGENIQRFADVVGFSHGKKKAKLASTLELYKRRLNRERFIARVESIAPDTVEDVYDVRIPGAHLFDANGVKVHNCGEQPLLPYESCNLGSINLTCVLSRHNGGYAVDYEKLKKLTRTAVHFLDNVIDLNRYPLSDIGDTTRANRKIGLGVMGFADMLIRLGIPYDSDEAVTLAGEIMAAIQEESKAASRELAKERGAFPNFERSDYAVRGEEPLRNATTTTIAPTGTISIIADTTSGIEPIFALAFVRNVLDNDSLVEVNPFFEEMARREGFYSDDLMKRIAREGSVAEIDEVPADIRKVFVTAHDISPEAHVEIQAAFQRHVDNAVSKTVNFPHSATVEDIERVYTLAYRLGCKGVTVYRDGSRENQVLEVKRGDEAAVSDGVPGRHITPRPRNEVTWGSTRKMTTGCGALYVTINEDERGLFEVFATMGKSGGCAASQTESVSRLISLSLRCGIEPEQIIKQLKGVRCPNQAWEKGGRIYSCADAIAKALERHLNMDSRKTANGSESAKNAAETNGKGSDVVMVGVCPECYGPLEFESGCSVCRVCGFSRCG